MVQPLPHRTKGRIGTAGRDYAHKRRTGGSHASRNCPDGSHAQGNVSHGHACAALHGVCRVGFRQPDAPRRVRGRHRLRIVGFVRRGSCAGHHRHHRHHRKHHVPVPRKAQALPIRACLPGVLPLLAHGNRHASHGRRPGERPSRLRVQHRRLSDLLHVHVGHHRLRVTTTPEAPRVSSASQEGRGRLVPSVERCLAPCPPSDKRGLRTP